MTKKFSLGYSVQLYYIYFYVTKTTDILSKNTILNQNTFLITSKI